MNFPGINDGPDVRRKGIGKIVAQIRAAHPNWSDDRVAVEAKTEWHRRNRPTKDAP